MESIRAFVRRNEKAGEQNWSNTFADAGYFPIELKQGHWQDVHAWCIEVIGKEHYCWTGSTFWFETNEQAFMFKLCWG